VVAGARWTPRFGLAALALLLLIPTRADAEWQIKPFFGVVFGGQTTLVDLDNASGQPHVVFGVTGMWLGEVIGFDVDLGYAGGFFQSGNQALVASSSATTLTGNVVIALPRRMTQYTLRPYFVVGAGFMHASIDQALGGAGLNVSSTLPATDVGGGVTGFLSKRIGLNWDVRYFQSVGRGDNVGLSIGPEQLSFWRANMAIAIRY
jgi:hypothetical protein